MTLQSFHILVDVNAEILFPMANNLVLDIAGFVNHILKRVIFAWVKLISIRVNIHKLSSSELRLRYRIC